MIKKMYTWVRCPLFSQVWKFGPQTDMGHSHWNYHHSSYWSGPSLITWHRSFMTLPIVNNIICRRKKKSQGKKKEMLEIRKLCKKAIKITAILTRAWQLVEWLHAYRRHASLSAHTACNIQSQKCHFPAKNSSFKVDNEQITQFCLWLSSLVFKHIFKPGDMFRRAKTMQNWSWERERQPDALKTICHGDRKEV